MYIHTKTQCGNQEEASCNFSGCWKWIGHRPVEPQTIWPVWTSC